MNAIGFKNFRNFVTFPMMPTTGVTLLVGTNNSGKSTCVKACRLLAQNLYKFINGMEAFPVTSSDELIFNQFDFSSVCGTYKRALSKFADSDIIELKARVGYFDVSLKIKEYAKGKDRWSIFGQVQSIVITDVIDDCSWEWSLKSKNIYSSTFKYTGKTLANIVTLKWLKKYAKDKNKSATIKGKLDQINEIRSRYEQLDKQFEYECASTRPFEFQMNKIELNGVCSEIIDAEPINDGGIFTPLDDTTFFIDFFGRIREDLVKSCNPQSIQYFPAHESPLDSAFSMNYTEKDSNAKTICQFYRKYYNSSYLKKWICKRMKTLGIGKNFEMRMLNSDFVKVSITNMDGNRILLADNGRGAVQLFMMLLRIAMCAVPKDLEESMALDEKEDYVNKYADADFPDGKMRENSIKKLLIFEEPEQNLHPAMQSKLADLFLEAYKLGVNILVETHSEYLVRRSQVIVAEQQYKDEETLKEKCPFKVYYMPRPVDGEPYEMLYRTDGNFENDFGTGFYDVASDLAFQTF